MLHLHNLEHRVKVGGEDRGVTRESQIVSLYQLVLTICVKSVYCLINIVDKQYSVNINTCVDMYVVRRRI